MHGLKDYYIALFRIRTALVGFMLLVLLGAFVVSCNKVDRNKVLSFFFEGVPPLGQDGLEEELVDSNSQQLTQMTSNQIWYVHEARKDCTNCHDKSEQRVFKPRPFLLKPVPKLCYDCHADFTASASFVHGPVAVGQCLLCHNPHKTRVEHLLKEPVPELCYRCHNMNRIKSIPAHLTKQQFACTDCHDAHTSSVRYLLKETSSLTDNGVDGTEAIQNNIQAGPKQHQEGLYRLAETKRTTALENNSMFYVFWTVSKLIEKGKIKEARTYLEKFKESNAFTNEEWKKIVQVLNLMDIAAPGTEKYAEKGKQQKAAVEVEPEGPITELEISSSQLSKNKRKIAELYYRSMAFYYAGQLGKAREGLIEVLKSDSIPPAVAKTIKDDLIGIDNHLTISDRKREIAELYYRSMAFYHAGQFGKARKGLVKVLKSGSVPEPMIITIKGCLTNIDNTLSRKPPAPEQ